MDDETREQIINTTPEAVYYVLRTYDRDLFVDPGNGFHCPLHHYFCHVFEMEPDDVKMEMYKVQLGYRGEGEFWCDLPVWTFLYQEAIMGEDWATTMGGCVDVLVKMYPEVLEVDEEEEGEPNEIVSVEACIAELEATYGTDRDPVSSAIYYLQLYAASLAYDQERN
jgi:hypothetical protein